MKKYLFFGIYFLVLVSIFSNGTTSAHAQQSRWYGIGYITGSFKGAQAKIEMANPTVRDTGGFSDETLWVLSTSTSRWVEVGWAKQDPPNDPRTMGTYLYYAWNDGVYHEKILELTTSHNIYKIIAGGTANKWQIYINNIWRATVDTGFSTADLIQVGGEVTSNTNAMGVSGTLNLIYKSPSNTWIPWSGTQIVQNTPYHVVRLNSSNSNLQNYGNNP